MKLWTTSDPSLSPVVTPSSRRPTFATVPVTWLVKTWKFRNVTESTAPAQQASITPNINIQTFGAVKPPVFVGAGFEAGIVEAMALGEMLLLCWLSLGLLLL